MPWQSAEWTWLNGLVELDVKSILDGTSSKQILGIDSWISLIWYIDYRMSMESDDEQNSDMDV